MEYTIKKRKALYKKAYIDFIEEVKKGWDPNPYLCMVLEESWLISRYKYDELFPELNLCKPRADQSISNGAWVDQRLPYSEQNSIRLNILCLCIAMCENP